MNLKKSLPLLGFIVGSTLITAILQNKSCNKVGTPASFTGKPTILNSTVFGFSMIFPDSIKMETNTQKDSIHTTTYSTFIARKKEGLHVSVTAIKTLTSLTNGSIYNYDLELINAMLASYNINIDDKKEQQVNGKSAYVYTTKQKDKNILLAIFLSDARLFIYEETFESGADITPTALNSFKIN